ncbi:uncharacterized protein A4U43_C10F6370 [Asparagus officinalis]|uniref:Uncharacterized protein n=1 Tax=Asparagus officinalis TaxID=4686 RepID=A0A5P1E143_ASPOF|nr:GATA transcription factor 26-like [Asparagus officinalis]ONK56301.1 uncharacterized protein A4U43_C10F6370 [Asparagus officinalis]
MGKHGPCRHCGVTTTPLWRNGPPDKPVLCNACGSRWRTKGSLTNYTPLHAREPIDQEEFKMAKPKVIPFKPKEKRLQKIKQSCGSVEKRHEIPYSDQNFRKILEGDPSNRSSSGSATSYSESCAHFGTTEASDLTGSAQSNVWESQVPSKKRTCILRPKPTPVEKLTKDLYTIMHKQQSSYLSSSEEDLLYEGETPIGSFEIGNGSFLLRYPNPKAIEEESEASSFPIDKSCIANEAYSGSASFPVHSESKGMLLAAVGIEKLNNSTINVAQGNVKRDISCTDKLPLLRDRGSPLGFTDLKDIVNFEVSMRHMTDEERQRLMKYLPSSDTAKYPESLRTMFNSSQFMETFSYFQQLLREGIFESSISGTDNGDYRILKRLVLQNFSRPTWVEHYKRLKDIKIKQNFGRKEIASRSISLEHSNFTSLKRAGDSQSLHLSELHSAVKSPKRLAKSGGSGTNPQSIVSLQPNSTNSRTIYDAEEFVDNDGTCFSPRTIFATPERSSLLCSLQFTDDSSDHDLLLDIPNNSSFPDAELLYNPRNQKRGCRNNLCAASGVIADGEESLSSFSSQKPR